jgi:type IV pilus biogenesis protein CpaD/CtpE
MKRSRALLVLTLAAATLAGCQSSHKLQTQAPRFDTDEPAYIQMSAGDRLGSAMVENRIYTARLKEEKNSYAVVEPQFGED